MKVKDLIKQLQDHDPELEVWVAANDEYAWALEESEVGVGDPTPTWQRKRPTFEPLPNKLVIGI